MGHHGCCLGERKVRCKIVIECLKHVSQWRQLIILNRENNTKNQV